MSFESSEEVYRNVLENLPTGVYLVDRDRRIVEWNAEAEKITGYLRQEVIGRPCFDNILMHCDDSSTVLCGVSCPLLGTMHDGRPRQCDVFLRHKDGQRVPVRVRAVPIRDAKGTIIGAAENFDERIILPEADVHPNDRAVHDHVDGLTGILDRHSMQSHLTASLLDFTEYHVPFSVLSIAIDKLDEFRDTHGRRGAEAIVSVVARTLSKNLHAADRVGRWEDGRFLVILMNYPASELARLAEMLKRIVSLAGIPWWGDRLSITISIGGTAARADDTVESVVGRSETALTASLIEGGQVRIY